MSLATRCPTCGTVFRVVHDQLLVSEGWVRCGRCAGVFNAADDLLDVGTGLQVQLAPPPGAVKPPRRATPEPAAATADLADRWEAASAASPDLTAPDPTAPAPATAAPVADEPRPVPPQDRAPAAPAAPASAAWTASAPLSDDLPPGVLLRAASQEPGAAEAADRVAAGLAPEPQAGTAEPGESGGLSATLADPVHAAAPALAALAAFPQEAPPDEPAPEFVRAADRAAAWRRPPVRAGAVVAALGLGALALVQAALLWRDPLAAQQPGLAGSLQALCRIAGCQVQPLHRIEQLSVDASGLSRVETPAAADASASAPAVAEASQAPQYRLNLTLRNRAETALAAPAVELSLTDSSGQLVLRRVLRLADLGAPQTVLAAGQELSLQALLAVDDHRIDGYTVELFYP